MDSSSQESARLLLTSCSTRIVAEALSWRPLSSGLRPTCGLLVFFHGGNLEQLLQRSGTFHITANAFCSQCAVPAYLRAMPESSGHRVAVKARLPTADCPHSLW